MPICCLADSLGYSCWAGIMNNDLFLAKGGLCGYTRSWQEVMFFARIEKVAMIAEAALA